MSDYDELRKRRKRRKSSEYVRALYNLDRDSREFKEIARREARLDAEFNAGEDQRLAFIAAQDTRVRAHIAKADLLARNGSAACEACGWLAPDGVAGDRPIIHAHHVVPVSCGGLNDDHNLVAICPNCHAIAHRLWSRGERPGDRVELLTLLQSVAQVARP